MYLHRNIISIFKIVPILLIISIDRFGLSGLVATYFRRSHVFVEITGDISVSDNGFECRYDFLIVDIIPISLFEERMELDLVYSFSAQPIFWVFPKKLSDEILGVPRMIACPVGTRALKCPSWGRLPSAPTRCNRRRTNRPHSCTACRAQSQVPSTLPYPPLSRSCPHSPCVCQDRSQPP